MEEGQPTRHAPVRRCWPVRTYETMVPAYLPAMNEHQEDGLDADGFDVIATELEARFRDGVASPWHAGEFERWALTVFRHQFETCATYRAFCRGRGVEPDTVDQWDEIPAVPATAFKYFDFRSGSARGDEGLFRTSGTTRPSGERGRHHVPRLELYRASLLAPFEAALVPEGVPIRFLSLIPNPVEAVDSSLSFMVGAAAERLATEIDWLVDAEGHLDEQRLATLLVAVRDAGEPVLMLGTALAFAHAMEREGVSLGPLPEGSRIMETGGFKGARRVISRADLYRDIAAATGVPTERIVNEYGMTELLSQLYEPVLCEGPGACGVHVPPPWLRVRALDGDTLRPVPDGEDGILAFFDLANLGSVSHILTEDIGSVVEGRVRLRGRAPAAEARGCSRAMDDLMSARR